MTTQQEEIIKAKLGLWELAKRLGKVSQACNIIGYSRDTFYRFQELHHNGGEAAVYESSLKRPILKNRVPEAVERAVVQMAIDFPAYGQLRAANEFKYQGIILLSRGVRSIWLRPSLEAFKKRLKALEAKMAQEGIIVTEIQSSALEKSKQEQESHGEIESEHPGYLGAQDTYFVGTLKGVGRIYQHPFIDTYSRMCTAKLYTEKTAITSADLLNDRVVPFFEGHGIKLQRVLTDSGTEYHGMPKCHAYQLYLAIEDIDHSRTRANHLQTNSICDRFYRTMQDECYSLLFRMNLFQNLEELQVDVD